MGACHTGSGEGVIGTARRSSRRNSQGLAEAWVTERKCTYDLSASVFSGQMTEHEAQAYIMDRLEDCMACCRHESQPTRWWIARRGAIRLAGQPGWRSSIFTAGLPSAKNLAREGRQLHCDDFGGKPESLGPFGALCLGWARPGRCEGLLDDVSHLEMVGSADPNDLDQGGSLDCSFICCLAVLAEYPMVLKRIIEPCVLDSLGRYRVKLYSYVGRCYVNLEVDDRLPKSRNGRPLFTNATRSGELWPCIVEKAMAKLLGGYQNIQRGPRVGCYPILSLGILVGCDNLVMLSDTSTFEWGGSWVMFKPEFDPKEPFNPEATSFMYARWPDDTEGSQAKDFKFVLEELLDKYNKQEFLMVCSPRGKEDFGISSCVYAIMDVAMNVAGTPVNLIRVRNPWAGGEWKGDWSDRSNTWIREPEVYDALHFSPMNDGSFWIDADDFSVQFPLISVCRKRMGPNRHKSEEDFRSAAHAKKLAIAQKTAARKSKYVGTLVSLVGTQYDFPQPEPPPRQKRMKLQMWEAAAKEKPKTFKKMMSRAASVIGSQYARQGSSIAKSLLMLSSHDSNIARQIMQAAGAAEEQVEFFNFWLSRVFTLALPRAEKGWRFLAFSTDIQNMELRIMGEAEFMMGLATNFVEACSLLDKSMLEVLKAVLRQLNPSELTLWCRLKRMGTDSPALDAGFIVHHAVDWMLADLLMPAVKEQDVLRTHAMQEDLQPSSWRGSFIPVETERSLTFGIKGNGTKRTVLSAFFFFKCFGLLKPHDCIVQLLASSNAATCSVDVGMGPGGLTRLTLSMHGPRDLAVSELAAGLSFEYNGEQVDYVIASHSSKDVSVIDFIVDARGYSAAVGFKG